MSVAASRKTAAPRLSLPDKVIAVHERFRAAKIPHAFGGALALAYYAEPRATIDIDVNVFAPTDRWRDAIDALASVGVESTSLNPAALERDGQCRLWWGNNPIDLFFSYDPIHEEMRKEARRVPFGDTTLPILSPEHLAICKAIFDRPKDWIDIEQMLVAVDALDVGKVERWLERMVGKRDPRPRHLEELKTALSIEAPADE
ncbi:MAG: nucleotidyl transferase AbiEii/AbiGii toxin family protein [Solirubrobacterales bacterium]